MQSREISSLLPIPKPALIAALLLAIAATAQSQPLSAIADSIRIRYHIPELGYAVISADSIIEMRTIGQRREGSTLAARPEDRFHLGSNTKGITGFIAARMVARGTITWQTKFFDLYPALRSRSNRAYRDITLLDLLTHRAGVPALRIGDRFPDRRLFHGDVAQRRMQLGAWLLAQPATAKRGSFAFSNAGFILAALMIERATGKSWERIVAETDSTLGLNFGWSYPNESDSLQPWGHDPDLQPVPPRNHDKEMLLSAAGNLNATVADYARFIQVQLLGLAGRSPLLSQSEFEFLHFGRALWAPGWEWKIATNGERLNAHTGSAGNFCSREVILPERNLAYVVLTNSATDQTYDGIDALIAAMEKVYGH